MIVFSFSLYGIAPKYTEGMIINATHIPIRFPDAWVYIYIASDVSEDIRERLCNLPHVKLLPVERKPGTLNTMDRFKAVDEPDVTVMFVRDADSRVHERDAACIEDFLASDTQFHIIRDHRNHTVPILAGMWGIRKSCLKMPMADLIAQWRSSPAYGNDQRFLASVLYPCVHRIAMIHDRYPRHESADRITPFRIPIREGLFVGQVHDFKDGVEVLVYPVN